MRLVETRMSDTDGCFSAWTDRQEDYVEVFPTNSSAPHAERLEITKSFQ